MGPYLGPGVSSKFLMGMYVTSVKQDLGRPVLQKCLESRLPGHFLVYFFKFEYIKWP